MKNEIRPPDKGRPNGTTRAAIRLAERGGPTKGRDPISPRARLNPVRTQSVFDSAKGVVENSKRFLVDLIMGTGINRVVLF